MKLIPLPDLRKRCIGLQLRMFGKAAERLPNSYPGIQRATKGAAYAFKARIAIYNEDYAAAATAAKNCMDLNVYKLHSNYQDLFTASWSDEWIFLLPWRCDVEEILLGCV